jgi:hypothetical protein
MAEANVEMMAYAPLDDPYAGHVEPNDENGGVFTTSEVNAKFYRKANWAGPPGTDPRDIQLEVAAEEYQRVTDARGQAREARQVFRNLGLASAQRGHSAAVGVMPQNFLLPQGEKARTNAQQNEAEGGSPDLVPQGTGGTAGEEEQDYEAMDVPALRKEHESRGFGKGSNKNKSELVEALEKDDEEKAEGRRNQ